MTDAELRSTDLVWVLQIVLGIHRQPFSAAPRWQKRLHPHAYHDKIRVIHEGIETARIRPDPTATFALRDSTVLRAGDTVVTYVSRHLDFISSCAPFRELILEAVRETTQ